MPDTAHHLSERLLSEGEKAAAFFEALTPPQWEQTAYTDGACWTVRQVLVHFVGAENSLGRLIANVAGGGGGTPEDFDLNGYNERKVREMEQQSTGELIAQFLERRKQNAEFVAGLSPADLEIQGRHPFLGLAPLAEMVKIVYRHNQIHLRELRRVISPESQ